MSEAIVSEYPSISVIIPAYNAAATLEHAVRSALVQTWRPLEIIVVDDGSRDRSADLAASIDPLVKVLRQANQGCGPARNIGARAAAGDWLAFLDADDAWLPQKLAKQIPFTRRPEVAVVNCRARNKQGEPLPTEFPFARLWRSNELIVSSTLVRYTAFEAVGGFWDRRAVEDYHLWLRLAAAGWTIANCPEDLVIYSPAPGSLSQQSERFAEAEIAALRDVAEQCGIPRKQLNQRLVSAYLNHARGAISARNLKLAREFLRRSFSIGLSPYQLWLFAVACTPAALLDLHRWRVDS